MARGAPKAWRVARCQDINRMLDVSPVGRHARDYAGLTDAQAQARRDTFGASDKKYYDGELVTIEELGGPLWAWRRMHPSGPTAPPFVDLGAKAAVNAACKAVLEEANLGAVRFHPIRILNGGRKSEPWPEDIYVMSVGNAKQALAIEHGLENGEIEVSGSPGIKRRPETTLYRTRFGISPRLTQDALEGPEIWMEPKLSRGNMFISDGLAKRLKAAKLTKGWGLKECSILPSGHSKKAG